MERYEFSDGKSDKFWEVAVNGKTLSVCYGRIGTAGQSKDIDFASPEAAEKEKTKLVKEKTGKGYAACNGDTNARGPAVKAAAPKAADKSTREASTGAIQTTVMPGLPPLPLREGNILPHPNPSLTLPKKHSYKSTA